MVWRTFLVLQDPATAVIVIQVRLPGNRCVVKLTLRRISTVVVREEAYREKQGKEQEPLMNMKKVVISNSRSS